MVSDFQHVVEMEKVDTKTGFQKTPTLEFRKGSSSRGKQ